MGTIVRVKGIKRYRHPKTWIWYCYHRKSGTAIVSEIGSVEFFSELSALENAAKRSEPVPAAHSPKAAEPTTADLSCWWVLAGQAPIP